jgi:hypothetical protein
MENGVTERAPAREEEIAPDAASDGSRGFGLRLGEFRTAIGRTPTRLLVVSALGAAAAVLMIVAELSTIASVDVIEGPETSCVAQLADREQADRCELSGLERHGGALILLGLVTFLMAIGAGVGASRPAAMALVLIGIVVLGLTLLLDLPKTDDTGAIGSNFEGAEASPGTGFYMELAAGLLALGAGALRLSRRESPRSPRADRPASSPPSA